MDSQFLNIVLMPFDFFADLCSQNPFNFTTAFFILIIISAVYRFLIHPITGGGSGSSDTSRKVRKK